MKKRILALLAVMALLMTMFALTSSASAYYAVYSHCKNGKPLNIRSGPGKEYESIGKVPYGEAIYVIGETYPGWLQLNDVGYVQAALTCRDYPGPYVPPTPGSGGSGSSGANVNYNDLFAGARQVIPYTITLTATRTSKGVANVRWAPSKKATLLRAYPTGTQVQVFAELNNWYQVYDAATNSVGFVNSAYVAK